DSEGAVPELELEPEPLVPAGVAAAEAELEVQSDTASDDAAELAAEAVPAPVDGPDAVELDAEAAPDVELELESEQAATPPPAGGLPAASGDLAQMPLPRLVFELYVATYTGALQ